MVYTYLSTIDLGTTFLSPPLGYKPRVHCILEGHQCGLEMELWRIYHAVRAVHIPIHSQKVSSVGAIAI